MVFRSVSLQCVVEPAQDSLPTAGTFCAHDPHSMTIGPPTLKSPPTLSLSAGVGFKTCFSVFSRFSLQTFLSMADSFHWSHELDDFVEFDEPDDLDYLDDLDDPDKLGDLDLAFCQSLLLSVFRLRCLFPFHYTICSSISEILILKVLMNLLIFYGHENIASSARPS